MVMRGQARVSWVKEGLLGEQRGNAFFQQGYDPVHRF